MHELGALLLSDVDVTHDLVELVPVNLRALCSSENEMRFIKKLNCYILKFIHADLLGILPRVSDRPLLRPLNRALDELVVDRVLHHDARTGGAALALKFAHSEH